MCQLRRPQTHGPRGSGAPRLPVSPGRAGCTWVSGWSVPWSSSRRAPRAFARRWVREHPDDRSALRAPGGHCVRPCSGGVGDAPPRPIPRSSPTPLPRSSAPIPTLQRQPHADRPCGPRPPRGRRGVRLPVPDRLEAASGEHHEVWLMDGPENAYLPFVLADTAGGVLAARLSRYIDEGGPDRPGERSQARSGRPRHPGECLRSGWQGPKAPSSSSTQYPPARSS